MMAPPPPLSLAFFLAALHLETLLAIGASIQGLSLSIPAQ